MQDNINPVIPVYVITNESHWDPQAIGDHGLARNVAQFHPLTFQIMKKNAVKAGLPFQNLEYEDSKSQIILMEWALKNGQCFQWTTCRKLEGIK